MKVRFSHQFIFTNFLFSRKKVGLQYSTHENLATWALIQQIFYKAHLTDKTQHGHQINHKHYQQNKK